MRWWSPKYVVSPHGFHGRGSPCGLNLNLLLHPREWTAGKQQGGAAFWFIPAKMAEFSPVLPIRDGGGRFGQPIFPRSRSGSESESELSQSLARTKIRSYGSTASVSASLGEKYIEHRVTDSDTLQGIALKYGVTVRHCLSSLSDTFGGCVHVATSFIITWVCCVRTVIETNHNNVWLQLKWTWHLLKSMYWFDFQT